MRITRKDVAAYAGVSAQTVSYILNGSRTFSIDIEQRVKKAVEELNYKPDMIAKSMVKKQTKSVAILVKDIANPIYGDMFHGYQERASEFGYSVYLADATRNVKEQISDLISRRIDGVYLSQINDENMNDAIQSFLSCKIPVVLGNKYENNKNCICYEVDLENGMKEIISYLSECGHIKIAYLSGLDINNVSDCRYKAIINNCQNMKLNEPVIIENEFPYNTNVETGFKLTQNLLSMKSDITAIVATNDLMAYGCIDALKKAGYKVPRDFSVIGIDDIMFSQYYSPPLTTLGYDKFDYGRKIFDILNNIFSNGNIELPKKYKTSLVKRDSVKNLND